MIGTWGDASVETYVYHKQNFFQTNMCLLLLLWMLDVSVLRQLAMGRPGCTCLLKCVLQLHLSFEPVTCWGKGYSPRGPLPPPHPPGLLPSHSFPLSPPRLHPCSLLNTQDLSSSSEGLLLIVLISRDSFRSVWQRQLFWGVICAFLHTSHKQWQGALYAHKACIQLHRPRGVWTLCVCFLGKGGSNKVIVVFYGPAIQWFNNIN